MPNQRGADQVSVAIYVDKDVKAAFKAATEQRGETITDVLVRAMRNYTRVTDRKGSMR
jgi:hypothetical protein